jgi:hypothetical protein
MTIWTKKHTTFSVQNRLTPTARELWQWLLDEMPEGSSEIIDLRDFNKWVEKTRGTPHDPKTVKSAAKKLIDTGVLIQAKSFTAYVWRWTLRPINLLVYPISRPTKKKSVCEPQIPGLDLSNQESVVDEDITTTTVLEDSEAREFEQKLEACKKAGIYYEPKDAKFLRDFSLHEVLKAILYFLFNREGVRKPEGWFKVSLEDNWAEKEEARQQLRIQWSTESLFEAIHHCKNLVGAV